MVDAGAIRSTTALQTGCTAGKLRILGPARSNKMTIKRCKPYSPYSADSAALQPPAETGSEWCSNPLGKCILCKRETCCKLRPQLQCCQNLNCTVNLADCRVPQQRSLSNTSRSDITFTTLAGRSYSLLDGLVVGGSVQVAAAGCVTYLRQPSMLDRDSSNSQAVASWQPTMLHPHMPCPLFEPPADQGTAQFPFYTVPVVTPGTSCESVRQCR
jgi:hypothetical protein